MRTVLGPIKGADFLHYYSLGVVVRDGRTDILYSPVELHARQVEAVPASQSEFYLTPYPPQVAVLFAPLAGLSYLKAYALWAVLTALGYALALRLAWTRCTHLRRDARLVATAAAGFPAFWQLVMQGQLTVVLLVAFVVAWSALDRGRPLVAGLVLGLLFLKPQLALALAAAAVYTRMWSLIIGAVVSVLLQVLVVAFVLGSGVWVDFLAFLRGGAGIIPLLEPKPFQMHSIRGFLELLLPVVLANMTWLVVSAVVVWHTSRFWKSSAALQLRMAVLLVTTVLVSPHLFVYDCALLAPALLWIVDWAVVREGAIRLRALAAVYFLFVALLVPVAYFTRAQVSVLLMLYLVYTILSSGGKTDSRPNGAGMLARA